MASCCHRCACRCAGVPLEALQLYRPPSSPDGSLVDWGSPIRSSWDMTEGAALKALQVCCSWGGVLRRGQGLTGGAARGGGGTLWAAGIASSSSSPTLLYHCAPQGFFASGLKAYEGQRHYADARAVSRLSPYLRWGQLGPRLVWQRMREAQ